MKDLRKFVDVLDENMKTLYNSDEMSEILQSLYNSLSIALNLHINTLVITPYQVMQFNEENSLIIKSPKEITKTQTLSNVEVFELILSRDKVVAELFEIIEKSEQEVKLKIKNE